VTIFDMGRGISNYTTTAADYNFKPPTVEDLLALRDKLPPPLPEPSMDEARCLVCGFTPVWLSHWSAGRGLVVCRHLFAELEKLPKGDPLGPGERLYAMPVYPLASSSTPQTSSRS
jgi:hypothetical protein